MGYLTRILQSKEKKALVAYNFLISKVVKSTEASLINETGVIIEFLKNNKLEEACGYSKRFDLIISKHRNGIQSLIITRFKPIFEENHEYSITFQEICKKVDCVYRWFVEIAELINQFRMAVDTGKVEDISIKAIKVQDKILYDNSINDLADALNALAMEYIVYLQNRPKDELSQLFDRMNFHIIVRKSSESLFKDGHYAPAILEASKALISYVRKKSKLTTKNDRNLMFDAYMPKKADNRFRIIKPALSLNPLIDETDWNEQEGFAYIFNGVVAGIRNPKAHDIIVQKDPHKTLEYLALISLLARRTDEAKLNA